MKDEFQPNILKKGVIEFELRASEHEVIYDSDFGFELGNKHMFLEEILSYVQEDGYLDDYKPLLALIMSDGNAAIKYRIRWNGSISTLVHLFIELIRREVLDNVELTFLNIKLSKIFSYFNKKEKDYLVVTKHAIDAYLRYIGNRKRMSFDVRQIDTIVYNFFFFKEEFKGFKKFN